MDAIRSRPTMRDVAALAGVSIKTVSRVVNHEKDVADVVRDRVQAAAERLHYRRHRGASDLRRHGGRTRAIGVLVQDVANDFSAQLLRAIEDTARAHGLAVLAGSLDEDPEREQALVADMVSRRIDGLVLVAASHRHDYLLPEQRSGLPVVFVDRPPVGIDADSVTVDNAAGVIAAVEHLLDVGHRRIAFVGDLPDIATARARHQGWLRAVRAVGADASLSVLGVRDEEQARAAVLDLLVSAQPPTALVMGRNVLTVGAMRALRQQRAEHSVAVVGFDDLPLFDLVSPAITVVQQDVRQLGAVAAELLVARLRGADGPPEHRVLQPRLVVRGSSTPPPPPPAMAAEAVASGPGVSRGSPGSPRPAR